MKGILWILFGNEIVEDILKVRLFFFLTFLTGSAIVLVFADSLVESISNLSDNINLSAFYIAFVVTPIASNASELYNTYYFASYQSQSINNRNKTTKPIETGYNAMTQTTWNNLIVVEKAPFKQTKPTTKTVAIASAEKFHSKFLK